MANTNRTTAIDYGDLRQVVSFKKEMERTARAFLVQGMAYQKANLPLQAISAHTKLSVALNALVSVLCAHINLLHGGTLTDEIRADLDAQVQSARRLTLDPGTW